MKTTEKQRKLLVTGAWRDFPPNVLDRVVTDLLDDLDEAIAAAVAWKASAEAWKARCERHHLRVEGADGSRELEAERAKRKEAERKAFEGWAHAGRVQTERDAARALVNGGELEAERARSAALRALVEESMGIVDTLNANLQGQTNPKIRDPLSYAVATEYIRRARALSQQEMERQLTAERLAETERQLTAERARSAALQAENERMREVQGVLLEVVDERIAQDRQWGGPDHDDEHDAFEWCSYIRKQLTYVNTEAKAQGGAITFRKRMLKVAALAIAGIQASDRRRALSQPASTEKKP